MNLFDKHPVTDPSVFVAPNATVVGNVTIAHKSNVWYGAVVRGEIGFALQSVSTYTLRCATPGQDAAQPGTSRAKLAAVVEMCHDALLLLACLPFLGHRRPGPRGDRRLH